MSSEWPTYRLEDCLDALIDYRGKTPEKTSSGIPLITAKIIKNGRIEKASEFIANDAYDAWMRRGIPQSGDVVLTTEAPLGEVAQLGKERIALAQRVVTLRGKHGLLDSTYLLYVLQTESMQDQLRARATGTTVLGIKQSELREVSVALPPLGMQKSAASALAVIDARIDMLRETNITLEAIAQTLFKSWFVDFDPVRAKQEGRAPEGMDEATAALFPDSFEASASASGIVPTGWRLATLGDVVQMSRKQIQPETMTTDTRYVGLEHIPRQSLGLDKWGNSDGLESAKSCFSKSDILFGKLRPYFHKIVIAPFAGVCSTDILVFKAKIAEYYGFAVMHLFSSELVAYADRLSNGAKMPRVNPKDLVAYELVMPPTALAVAFNEVVQPMFSQITANVLQAENLATLRDTLLPRLISGQLRLPEGEEMAAQLKTAT
jgi:type I restriction enzyme S subunit